MFDTILVRASAIIMGFGLLFNFMFGYWCGVILCECDAIR